MAKSEATPEGADRRHSSTRATARDHSPTRDVAAKHINPYSRQRRNAYDGNGEYEYATAHHYVPNYTEGFILHETEAGRMKAG